MRTSNHRWWIAAAALTCVLAAGNTWYILDKPAAAPQPAAQHTVSRPSAKPKPVTIDLPGATPIPAIAQDYTAPDSVWLVVSKTRPLSDQHYQPYDLVAPSFKTNTQKSAEEQSIRQLASPAAKELFDAAGRAGHDIMMASGYRSYDLQEKYYTNYVRISGEAEASKFSARPGQSEHQTGLAFDISLASRECYLETCFGNTDAGKWLAAHAYDYGFILRYPADKTDITGYQYEPWHFRYVGVDLAKALHEGKLTLDEANPYLEKALRALREQNIITSP